MINAKNPRYLAYCAAQGRAPDAQLDHDRAEFPGGCMAGYMTWIQSELGSFRRAHSMSPRAPLTTEQNTAFDAGLSA